MTLRTCRWVAVAWLGCWVGATGNAAPPLGPRVDPLVEPYLKHNVVVGLVVGIVDQGETWIGGYGRLSQQEPTTPDGSTIFEIGSISKVFTGVLLADAATGGRVRLDLPVGQLLPNDVTLPASDGRPMTLQDLATHVSGLPRLPANLAPADPRNPYADYSVENLYEFLNNVQLTDAPGQKSEYSNLGAGLLGHLLARQAHASYDQLLKQRIAEPLGMSDTAVDLTAEQLGRVAPPHTADQAAGSTWDLPTLAGAGAIRSTANDLAAFAAACLDPPDAPIGKAIALSWEIHQPPLKEGAFAMGLGWHVARDGQTRWHNGQTGGYHAALFVHRPSRSAVALLANTATGEVDRLAEQLIRMLAGNDEKPRQFEEAVNVPAEIVARYRGKYQLAPGFILTVTADQGKLFAQATGQPKLRLDARSETEWAFRVVDATLTFLVDEQGVCQSAELFQNGLRMPAARID